MPGQGFCFQHTHIPRFVDHHWDNNPSIWSSCDVWCPRWLQLHSKNPKALILIWSIVSQQHVCCLIMFPAKATQQVSIKTKFIIISNTQYQSSFKTKWSIPTRVRYHKSCHSLSLQATNLKIPVPFHLPYTPHQTRLLQACYHGEIHELRLLVHYRNTSLA